MSINFVGFIAKPKITLTKNPFHLSFSINTTTKPFILATFCSMSYDKELAAAKKAASLAARLCQKVQIAILQSDVQSKSDKSPVTVADYGSQALVSYALQRELPSELFSMVAEEDSEDLCKDSAQETLERITKLVNDILASDGSYSDSTLSTDDVVKAIDCGKSEGGSQGRHWVLDPIDGTKGFLRGDQYAIALALLDEGKVVLGVLACPNLPLTCIAGGSQHSLPGEVGCLFFSVVGGGTYMHSLHSSSAVKVQVSSIDNPEEASFFESYEAAHSMHDLSSSIAKKLGVKAPPVRIDSQAKYGALSRGDGVIYLRFPHKGYREKIWDHAAGYIVVAEAGGVVTDAAGNPLDFSKGRYLDLDTGIIVTNPKLMPSLLQAVRESIEEKVSSL
uniref:3'(2'),5'-bisphosphate nucleotidase n=1 Tax=Salix viminalis TaxID=40686 RepID=A0A6N2KUG9_SALVM